MKSSVQAAIMGAITIVVLTLWIVLRIGSGKPSGETCTVGDDGVCKGWRAQCLAQHGVGYCSHPCKLDGDCPTTWTCGVIELTRIDGKGNATKESTDLRMCLREAPARTDAGVDAAPSGPPPVELAPTATTSPTATSSGVMTSAPVVRFAPITPIPTKPPKGSKPGKKKR